MQTNQALPRDADGEFYRPYRGPVHPSMDVLSGPKGVLPDSVGLPHA